MKKQLLHLNHLRKGKADYTGRYASQESLNKPKRLLLIAVKGMTLSHTPFQTTQFTQVGTIYGFV